MQMTDKDLIVYLEQFISEKRKTLFHRLIANRTRYFTVVLEDIFQPQNASAVLRTCDCLGIQDIHIIENNNKYRINPDVTLGSDKWLSLKRYHEDSKNTTLALNALRAKGYRIIATTPHKNDILLEDFSIDAGKAAFVFGTEKGGLSKEALAMADEYLKIPMSGFTESFNISVSAAIILYNVVAKMRRKKGINWQLPDDERDKLLLDWLISSISNSKGIVAKYYNDHADA
jgi:tRNA (guanosine-2'-O-)-methyltransferase